MTLARTMTQICMLEVVKIVLDDREAFGRRLVEGLQVCLVASDVFAIIFALCSERLEISNEVAHSFDTAADCTSQRSQARRTYNRSL